ncbi:MAG TPA: FAD-binding oxidoreductase, partial [Polyangiaceae bacterium]|nr:FAD-binding oxidoreductase [Polyangiaceae bacterium]
MSAVVASRAIPRLDPRASLEANVVSFLDALAQGGFRGDIRSDYGTRLTAATDNSIYQLLPQAVIFPREQQDVALAVRLLAEPRFEGVSLTARGGGTGTNGQALTGGVVMDLSRHMGAILELNLAEGWVSVQPGVVLDDLNAYLKPHGVYFAANLSPSNRATMGGMISTDASGEGSRLHGKTSRHVLELSLVLRGGIEHRTRRVSGPPLDELCARTDVVGEAYRLVREIAQSKADDIQRTFPKLLRYMTGYNLAHMATRDGQSVDLGQLVAGSEGSLAVVTEARLKLTPFQKQRALFVLRYPSFDDALASSEWLVATEP